MAKIANNYCKKIYITDDNPRNENPRKIRNDLQKYIPKDKALNIEIENWLFKKQYKTPVQMIILVAGKGHEEQQIYKNKILNISDKKIIKKIV